MILGIEETGLKLLYIELTSVKTRFRIINCANFIEEYSVVRLLLGENTCLKCQLQPNYNIVKYKNLAEVCKAVTQERLPNVQGAVRIRNPVRWHSKSHLPCPCLKM